MRKRAGRVRAIRQDSQQGEQVRPALNLVDDHEPREWAERLPRRLQAGQIQGVFEIEIGVSPRGQFSGQGGLAALAGTEQGSDPEMSEGVLDLHTICSPVDEFHA